MRMPNRIFSRSTLKTLKVKTCAKSGNGRRVEAKFINPEFHHAKNRITYTLASSVIKFNL